MLSSAAYRIVLSCALLMPSAALLATDRLVSPGGSDTGNCSVQACATIGYAITQTNNDDRIVIAAGTYTESIEIPRPLTLAGAGQALTIIQAHPEPGMASSRVVRVPQGIVARFEDLTIRHGVATAGSPANRGGGIYNERGEVHLTRVRLSANRASVGGGLYNFNLTTATVGGEHVLIDVVIDGNLATSSGGGVFNQNVVDASYQRVLFENNTAQASDGGGGQRNFASNPRLEDVQFIANSAGEGGAMKNTNASSPILLNVLFAGNSSTSHGGGLYNQQTSDPELTNVAFLGNRAQLGGSGGGMFNTSGSQPLLTNVTFSGNRATSGGAIRNTSVSDGGLPELRNVIIWNNQDDTGVGTLSASIRHDNTTPMTISYSLVQSWNPPGTGNLNGNNPLNNPRFQLAPAPELAPQTAGNLRLRDGSPAIDVGFDTYVSGITTDLGGAPRIQGSAVDLGAYEYDPPLFRDRFQLP